MRKMKRFFMIFGFSAVIATIAGCIPLLVGAGAAAGGIVWAEGALQQNFQRPLYKVHAASLKGLDSLKLSVLVEKKEGTLSKIESEFPGGKHIWISVKHLTQESCELSIRVGALGDEVKSRQILEAITKFL